MYAFHDHLIFLLLSPTLMFLSQLFLDHLHKSCPNIISYCVDELELFTIALALKGFKSCIA